MCSLVTGVQTCALPIYLIFWMLAIALEGLAGASILVLWFPALAVWQIGLILVFGMTMLNLLSVRAFGESEFWLSGIKVAAIVVFIAIAAIAVGGDMVRSEEHTSELQSLMRISYAVFCLNKKK